MTQTVIAKSNVLTCKTGRMRTRLLKQEMVFFYYHVTVIFLAHFPGHTFRVTSHRLCLHASLVLHDKYQCPNPAEKTIALEITHRPAHIHKNVAVNYKLTFRITNRTEFYNGFHSYSFHEIMNAYKDGHIEWRNIILSLTHQ